MVAFFTNEEKLDSLRGTLKYAVALHDTERAILEAIAADYETLIAIGPERAASKHLRAETNADEHAVTQIAAGFTPIKSSNLTSVKHDNATGEMTVRFRNGTAYVYYGVGGEIYRAVLGSDHPGKTFHARVATGGFRFTKVEDWR